MALFWGVHLIFHHHHHTMPLQAFATYLSYDRLVLCSLCCAVLYYGMTSRHHSPQHPPASNPAPTPAHVCQTPGT